MTRSWGARPIGGAAMVVAMTLVLAACGGGSTKTATAATTTTTVAGAAARLATFRQCMLTHGVTLPANFALGGGGGGGAGRGRGGGGPGGTGSTGSTTDTTGVPRTAPSTTIPAGVTPAQWQAAITACLAGRGGGGNLQNNPQFQLYYNCLQSYLTTHGETTLPPLSSGGAAGLFGNGGNGAGAAGAGGASGSTSTTNPGLQAARDHCAALRPAFNGGTTTTTTKS